MLLHAVTNNMTKNFKSHYSRKDFDIPFKYLFVPFYTYAPK